jgi:hypothetical protein
VDDLHPFEVRAEWKVSHACRRTST